MQIESLHVENFRGFEERDFSFDPQFNVLIGDNGTGKTAVLEALKVAIGSWLLGIPGSKRPSKAIAKEEVRLKGYMQESTGRYNFEEQYDVVIESTGIIQTPHEEKRVSWTRRRTKSGGTTRTGAKKLKRLAEEADERVRQDDDVTMPVITYYGTDRLHHPEPRKAKAELSRLAGYNECLDGKINVKHLKEWIDTQDRLSWKKGESSLMYDLVRQAVAGMIDGAEKIDYDPSREDVIVILESGDVRPLKNLSDGYRTTLALVGDLATRIARLNPGLGENALRQTPGVVLIDELDLHLHPKWQRHVVDDLKCVFQTIQYITTTHSPFIIQSLDQSEVYALNDQFPSTSPQNFGIETISKEIMGVDHPEQSLSYRKKVAVAKDYLSTLEEAANAPEERLEEYKQRLASKLEPYADNPAFQAYLELEREGRLGE